MKKFFRYALRIAHFALLIAFLTTTAQAAQPVRIARLPIIIRSTMPDLDTRTDLEFKIARALHIPLNKTLNYAEYLPTKDCADALSGIWQRLRAADKKAKLADAMRPLAAELNADIVVCPVLLTYRQYEMHGWDETVLDSQARAELIVYDRRNDSLVDKKAGQMFHEGYHPRGTASALAKICFDQVIKATKLRELIMAIRQ